MSCKDYMPLFNYLLGGIVFYPISSRHLVNVHPAYFISACRFVLLHEMSYVSKWGIRIGSPYLHYSPAVSFFKNIFYRGYFNYMPVITSWLTKYIEGRGVAKLNIIMMEAEMLALWHWISRLLSGEIMFELGRIWFLSLLRYFICQRHIAHYNLLYIVESK